MVEREIDEMRERGFTPCAIFPAAWMENIGGLDELENDENYEVMRDGGAIRIYRRREGNGFRGNAESADNNKAAHRRNHKAKARAKAIAKGKRKAAKETKRMWGGR